ncbi:MAG TPA: hypothetical protein PKV71_13250 [Calditrichia bacterium]|nr:hypothetical protein [Calditrichota bacterium]HQV32844.1 hypothetical protein [Calditrichia bacterium]
MRRNLLGILLVAAVFFWQCEENPVETQLGDRTANLVVDTLYATIDNTLQLDEIVPTFTAERVLVGSYQSHTFRPILKFNGILASAIIDSAWLELAVTDQIGDSENPFTIRAHPAINNWLTDTSEVWMTNPDDNIDRNTVLGQMQMTAQDSTTDTLNLVFSPTAFPLLEEWADANTDTTLFNNGIILEGENPEFVREILARDILGGSGITLYYRYHTEEDDSVLEASTIASTDAFLIQGNYEAQRPGLPDYNFLTTYTNPYVMVLGFDLEVLRTKYPDGILPSSMILQLPVDLDYSLPHPSDTYNPDLRVMPLLSNPDSAGVRVDSSRIFSLDVSTNSFNEILMNRYSADEHYIEVNAGSERSDFAAAFMFRRLNQGADSTFKGLAVEFRQQNQYMSYFSFYRYNNPDPANRPRLILYSLKLPAEPF